MKKQIVRLTESDLHRIIKESVKRIIDENYGEPDDRTAIIYSDIIEDYQAQEIADEYGISVDEAAAEWFKGVAGEMDFAEDNMPKYREFVMDIPELESKLYHDYGAEYYFLVKNADPSTSSMAMESIVRRSVKNILKETDCAGVMQTGCGDSPKGTNPEAGQYTTAFGPDKETSDRHGGFSIDGKAKWNKNPGNVQRREVYNPKSGKKR